MDHTDVDAAFARAFDGARDSFLSNPPGRQTFASSRAPLDPALLGMPARVSVSFDLQAKADGYGGKGPLRLYGSCSARLERADAPIPCPDERWGQAEAYISFACSRDAKVDAGPGREAFDAALAKAVAMLPGSAAYRAAREAFDIGLASPSPASRSGARL